MTAPPKNSTFPLAKKRGTVRLLIQRIFLLLLSLGTFVESNTGQAYRALSRQTGYKTEADKHHQSNNKIALSPTHQSV